MGSSNSAGGKEYDRVASTGVEAALYRRKSEVGTRWDVGMGCCGHQVIDTPHYITKDTADTNWGSWLTNSSVWRKSSQLYSRLLSIIH